jgi:hypothetical protein
MCDVQEFFIQVAKREDTNSKMAKNGVAENLSSWQMFLC